MFLEDKVGALQSEVEQSITTQEAYENQVATLNQSLANLEAKLCECNEEKVGTIKEITFQYTIFIILLILRNCASKIAWN